MKVQVIFILLFFLLLSCDNNSNKLDIIDLIQIPATAIENSEEVQVPEIVFSKEVFNFGEIYQDKSISFDFKFQNIGNAPLIIRSVKASCGCTVAEWPRKQIAQGGDGVITVTFNSGKRSGKQNKTVTLVTNEIPSTKVLIIKGTVLVPQNNEL